MRKEKLKEELGLTAVFATIVAVSLFVVAPLALGTDTPLAVVSSWSMEPTLHVGDIIVVYGRDRIREGDIVVYVSASGTLIVHRVIAIEEGAFGLVYVTKGDANPTPDTPVPPSRVKGKVILVIPYLGNIKLLFERMFVSPYSLIRV